MTQDGNGMDEAWNALEARVAAADAELPAYRRVWFQSLIRQGREAEAAGRAALAVHCRARAERELAAYEAPATPAPSASATSATSGESVADASDAVRVPRPSALAALAQRREQAGRLRVGTLLDRHASRMSPDEAAEFRTALEAAPDSGLADLRRRLLSRLLRAERYRRQGARLALWKPPPPPATPAGPYNDRRALEDLLHRLATRAPAWTAEFLDIHAEFRAVRALYGSLLPGSKG